MIWDVISLEDRNTRLDYGIVFPGKESELASRLSTKINKKEVKLDRNIHITHRNHVIDFRNTQPM